MTDLITRVDGEHSFLGGRHVRAMLPTNRRGAWVTRQIGSRTVEMVTSNLGDVSGDDLRLHPGHPEQCPPRSQLVYDVDPADTRGVGVRARASFDFNLYPSGGPAQPISADRVIIFEYNAWPIPGRAGWGPPPFSLDLRTQGGVEGLYATVFGMNGGKFLPVARARPHRIEVEYVFAAGGSGGRALVHLDNAELVNFTGSTGQAGYSGVFPAIGLYGTVWRPRGESIAVNFENTRVDVL